MSPSTRRLAPATAALLLAGPLAAAAGQAWAQDPRPVRLRYQAPAGCPDEATFWATVRRRAPGARQAEGDAAARVYDVSIRTEGDVALGRLEVESAAGRSLVREIRGESCEDAAAALAFVTALALEEGRGPVEPAASSAAAAPASAAPASPRSLADARAPAPDAGPPVVPAPSGLAGSVAVGAVGTGAVGPGLAAGAEVAVEAAWAPGPGPSVRLSGLFAANAVEAGPGRARFQLRAVRLGGCPVSVAAGPVRLAPCASYELGSLRAQGQGVDEPIDEARLWHAAHLDARARWSPAGRWFLELGAGLVLPLTSRTFVFDAPRTDVFAVPRLAGAGAAAVGMLFP